MPASKKTWIAKITQLILEPRQSGQLTITQQGKILTNSQGTSRANSRKLAYAKIADSVPEVLPIAIICDTSASMAASGCTTSNISLLHQTLDSLARTLPPSTVVVQFAWSVRKMNLKPGLRFSPKGGTMLSKALRTIQELKLSRAVLLCDGQPIAPKACLEIASGLAHPVDAIFCGPATDKVGIEFMEKLAAITGGNTQICDLAKQQNPTKLIETVNALIVLPAPR